MSSECHLCHKSMKASDSLKMNECSHRIHFICLNKKQPDFDNCRKCNGELKEQPQTITEECMLDGRDYVVNPLDKRFEPPAVIGYIYDAKKKREQKEPFCWLKDKKSIEWMDKEKKCGLQMMLKSGVIMDDFLNYGYSWNDLKKYPDFQNKERGKLALKALHCNAEHFRDFPQYFDQVRKDLSITPKNIVEEFNFVFPPNTINAAMVVNGKNTTPWTASDLVKLGFKKDDLTASGLTYLEQYIALQPTNADETSMGITVHFLNQIPLKNPIHMEPEPEPEPEPIIQPQVTTIKYTVVTAPPTKKAIPLHGLRKK